MRYPRAVSYLASLGALLMLAGCSHYNVYTENPEPDRSIAMADAPEWVRQGVSYVDEPNRDDQIFFVGRSVGYTSLDERGAYDAAMDHARQQLAWAVCSEAGAVGAAVDFSDGIRHMPRQKWDLDVEHASVELAHSFTRELLERQVYWEVWNVREDPFPPLLLPPKHKAVKRYKCWVLTAIPRDRYEQLIGETKEAVRKREILTVVSKRWRKDGKLPMAKPFLTDPAFDPYAAETLHKEGGYLLISR